MSANPTNPGVDLIPWHNPKNDAQETEMLKISLSNPESGWAYARLSDQSKELLVTAPYSPDDVLLDFVDAVQSLQSAEAVECCCRASIGEMRNLCSKLAGDGSLLLGSC